MLPVLCPADRGRNSEERRRQRRETTTHVGLEIVRAVVVLLTFLGLVSRDVKPENVGVVGEGRIALIDWDRGRGRAHRYRVQRRSRGSCVLVFSEPHPLTAETRRAHVSQRLVGVAH